MTPGMTGRCGKCPGKERLVDRDVLEGADALALVAFEHAVDEQERVAVRQQAHHAHDVERMTGWVIELVLG